MLTRKYNNNNNNNLIYIAQYAELQRRWTTVSQAAVNRNVFRYFLKTESVSADVYKGDGSGLMWTVRGAGRRRGSKMASFADILYG